MQPERLQEVSNGIISRRIKRYCSLSDCIILSLPRTRAMPWAVAIKALRANVGMIQVMEKQAPIEEAACSPTC